MSWMDKISAWLDRFGIKPFAPYEVIFMRVFFAAAVFFLTFPPERELFATQPKPNGFAQFIDFTFFADPDVYARFEAIAIICLVLYAAGVLHVVALPYLAWFSIATKTLANSQGGISHSYQMISLILLVQAAVAVAEFGWALAKGKKVPWFAGDRWWNSSGIYYSQLAIAGCYVVAAVTKLLDSGGTWLWNSPHLVKELVKTQRQNFYSTLDPQYAGEVPHVDWLSSHPMVARLLFSPGLLFELLAFVALLGRRWALGTGLALIALHEGIRFFMGLKFTNFEACLTIFFINVPFWIAAGWKKLAGGKAKVPEKAAG